MHITSLSTKFIFCGLLIGSLGFYSLDSVALVRISAQQHAFDCNEQPNLNHDNPIFNAVASSFRDDIRAIAQNLSQHTFVCLRGELWHGAWHPDGVKNHFHRGNCVNGTFIPGNHNYIGTNNLNITHLSGVIVEDSVFGETIHIFNMCHPDSSLLCTTRQNNPDVCTINP